MVLELEHVTFGARLCMVLELEHLGKEISNTSKILTCGARAGRKRSVGLVV
jgi:hypothetical protein